MISRPPRMAIQKSMAREVLLLLPRFGRHSVC
jgi:hypothetical protein